ncbi:hypothetical protein D3C78_1357950 [compost metagenome]
MHGREQPAQGQEGHAAVAHEGGLQPHEAVALRALEVVAHQRHRGRHDARDRDAQERAPDQHGPQGVDQEARGAAQSVERGRAQQQGLAAEPVGDHAHEGRQGGDEKPRQREDQLDQELRIRHVVEVGRQLGQRGGDRRAGHDREAAHGEQGDGQPGGVGGAGHRGLSEGGAQGFQAAVERGILTIGKHFPY